MENLDHPLALGLVRIHDTERNVIGAGFLATGRLICTCAHAVADALHISRDTQVSPSVEIQVDFPYLNGAPVSAAIVAWQPIAADGGGDIAVLRLSVDPPPGARPVRMLIGSNATGRQFEAYGFPLSADAGVWAQGTLGHRLSNGLVQMEAAKVAGYRVQPGFSGGPVWDVQARGVIGMVVAAEKDVAVKAAFLIPNDLIQRVCSDIKLVDTHRPFAVLTAGLAGLPGSPLSGVEQFFREYLGMPGTSPPFGGRQKEEEALDQWLAEPTKPYALMVAEAGRGKSALLAHWAAEIAEQGRADVVFVPVSIRFGTALKSTSLSLLGARLRALHKVRADPPRDSDAWLAEIEVYLREDRPVETPLLIVLDGIDEAADWTCGQDLRFPPVPGRRIKVLISARQLANCDATGWLRRLEWEERATVQLALPQLDRKGVAEVLYALGDPLTSLSTRTDVVSELFRLSSGEPLLVRLYIESLQRDGMLAAVLRPEELQHLKPGLEAYFERWWEDQRRHWQMSAPLKEPLVRALLNMLACALGPLTIEDVLALLQQEGLDSWMLGEIMLPLARFVIGDGKRQGYVFSHPRLSQYFREEKLTAAERTFWEQRFLAYGRQILEGLNAGRLVPKEAPGYIVQHYGAHLEQADTIPDHFNTIVSEGWLRAWEALEGTYDGFLKDLRRAWRKADEAGMAGDLNEQERGGVVSLQCRYALIAASINSLASNIPPGLLASLIEMGVWTPIQGLAYARRVLDEEQRMQALVGLSSQLPQSLLQEALMVAREIANRTYRVQALVSLALCLPEEERSEALTEVLQTIKAIQNQAEVVAWLAHQGYKEKVLPVAREIANPEQRAWALASLIPLLAETDLKAVLAEALVAVRAIGDARIKVDILTAIALRLPGAERWRILDEILTLLQTIREEGFVSMMVTKLTSYLSEAQLKRALEITNTSLQKYWRVNALTRLLQYLPETERTTRVAEALRVARSIEDKYGRAVALGGLVSLLPETERSTAMTEALESTRAIAWEGQRAWRVEDGEAFQMMESATLRAWALVDFARYLPREMWPALLVEALLSARAIEDSDKRAETLIKLIPYVLEVDQPAVFAEALVAIHALEHKPSQYFALREIAPHEAEPLLPEALATVATIKDPRNRAAALDSLAPYLPVSLLREALEITIGIRDEYWREETLAVLVPQLAELGLGERALGIARTIQEEYWRAVALVDLVQYLPEEWHSSVLLEALTTVREIRDVDPLEDRNEDRQVMVVYPWYDLLTMPRTIGSDYRRIEALLRLIARLTEPLLQQVLSAVQQIQSVEDQSRVLAGFARRLAQLGYGQDALVVVQMIEDGFTQSRTLETIAPYLSEVLLREAEGIARAMTEVASRTEVLATLALQTPKEEQLALFIEILGKMHETMRLDPQVRVLINLAPFLPVSLMDEALAVARDIADADSRAQALLGLVPFQRQEIQHQVLMEAQAAIRLIQDSLTRVQLLAKLASLLPASEKSAAISEALAIARAADFERIPRTWPGGDDKELLGPRVQALAEVAPYLPQEEQLIVLHEAEAIARTIPWADSRYYQFATLVSKLAKLGHSAKALELAQAIENAGSRAKALAALMPHWPRSLQCLEEALATVWTINDGPERAEAFSAFVPYLIDQPLPALYPLWRETLHKLASGSRREVLEGLCVLAPIITTIGGKTALIDTMLAIDEVGRWFL